MSDHEELSITLTLNPPQRPIREVLGPALVEAIMAKDCDETDEPVVFVPRDVFDELAGRVSYESYYGGLFSPLEAVLFATGHAEWSDRPTLIIRNHDWNIGLQVEP